jgi:hypothetical protein
MSGTPALLDENHLGETLEAPDYSGRVLARCSFRNALVKGGSFRDAVLYDVDFRGADLLGTDFTGARFFRSARVVDGEGGGFPSGPGPVLLDFARAEGCSFDGALLCGVDAKDARFVRCRFDGAVFGGVRADGVSFDACDFTGADLTAAAGWRRIAFRGCTARATPRTDAATAASDIAVPLAERLRIAAVFASLMLCGVGLLVLSLVARALWLACTFAATMALPLALALDGRRQERLYDAVYAPSTLVAGYVDGLFERWRAATRRPARARLR